MFFSPFPAGTAQYETKRNQSVDIIEKKEQKLKELKSLMEKNITPKLNKLREDKANYDIYQKICREFEYLTRLHISHKYLEYHKTVESSEDQINDLNVEMKEHQELITANETESAKIDDEVKEIQNVLDAESGGELKGLEKQLDEMNKKDAGMRAEITSSKEAIFSEEKKIKLLVHNIKTDENALKKKEDEMGKVRKRIFV